MYHIVIKRFFLSAQNETIYRKGVCAWGIRSVLDTTDMHWCMFCKELFPSTPRVKENKYIQLGSTSLMVYLIPVPFVCTL